MSLEFAPVHKGAFLAPCPSFQLHSLFLAMNLRREDAAFPPPRTGLHPGTSLENHFNVVCFNDTRDCVPGITPFTLLMKRAGVAQLVERQFCKLRVGGSIPSASSKLSMTYAGSGKCCPSKTRPKPQTTSACGFSSLLRFCSSRSISRACAAARTSAGTACW